MRSAVEKAERKVIREHAAQWLIELQEDAPERHEEFSLWVRQSPRHVEEFLFAAAAWKALDRAGPAEPAQVEKLIARALSEISTGVDAANVVALEARHVAEKVPKSRHRWWVAGLAASALLAVLVYFFATAPTYRTAIGEQRTARLPDGSVLYLNTDTRVQVRYSDTERQMRLLQGEALFVVARDVSRPFRVKVGDTVIQALGTQFNVHRELAGTTVVVLEGSVKVESAQLRSSGPDPTVAAIRGTATAQLLSAGEGATVNRAGSIVKRDSPDVAAAVAWRERQLVFRGNTLEEIASEVNRYGSRRFRVEGDVARQRRIAGTFSADDPEALLRFIREYQDLTVETSADEVVIRAR
jgi:transmembrane sensor